MTELDYFPMIVDSLEVASTIAAQQGLAVERPDVPGSIVITGLLEGEKYQLVLRFAEIAGQLALSSAANSSATILDARTVAERKFYTAFWEKIRLTGLRIAPVEDYATNVALLAPLLGTKTHGDIVALETVDGHVVVADLSQAAPPPTESEWGSFEAAGFAFESIGTTYRLYWMVTLASELEGECKVEVDEVTGPSARRLIQSRFTAREGKLSARSPGIAIDQATFPWLFDGKDSLFVFRVRISHGGESRVLYQPVFYSASNKKVYLDALKEVT